MQIANSDPFPENPVKNKHIIGKWKCKKCHEWDVPVHSRTLGNDCPECANQKVGKD